MFLRTAVLLFALLAPLQPAIAAGPVQTEAERAAIDDAFAASMYNPVFVEAAKAGKAVQMRDILLANGAPGSLMLTAQGMKVESTHGEPVPSQYPNNDGACVQWRLVTWRSSIPPYGYYTMWVCVTIVSHGVVTYDAR